MKVYIYSEFQDKIEKSGVGRAIYHQKAGLAANGIECTDNCKEADVIHINTVFPKSFFLALKAKRLGIPVVYHAHSTKEDFRDSYIGSNLFAGLFKLWIKLCYSMGDVIVTPSEYSKKLLESYHIKKDIAVISNGIDLSAYNKSESAGKAFREKYGYSDSDKVIMSAGLTIKRKGILDFIELAKRMPQYKFIWFGSADLRFVGKEVRRAVAEDIPNLTFAGYVPPEQLKAAYSGSDLFLFPSYEETEGIVVLEALAMKIPVLLRDIPVYDGWLVDGKRLYKADSNEAFEKTACMILEHQLPDLTEWGYDAVEKKNIEHIGSQLLGAYKMAIKAKSSVRAPLATKCKL